MTFSIATTEHTTQTVSAHGLTVWQFVAAAAILVVLCAWAYSWLRKTELTPGQRWPLLALRIAFALVLLICLFAPVREETQTTTSVHTPELLVAVDQSASLSLLNAQERRAQAIRAVDEFLDKHPEVDHRMYAVGASLRSLNPAPGEADPETAEADQSTRLVDQLRALAERVDPARGASMLLITDGQDTDQAPIADAVMALKSHNVLTFPVSLPGLDQPSPLARIESIESPEAVRPRQVFPLNVMMRLRGMAGRQLELVLEDVSSPQAVVKLNAQPVIVQVDGTTRAAFEHRLENPGSARLRATLRDPANGYVFNSAYTAINATIQPTIRVLYVQGALGWEYRFLRQAFNENPSIQLDSVARMARNRLLSQTDGEAAQYTASAGRSASFGSAGGDLTASIAQSWRSYDVVILADLAPNELSREEQQGLLKLVRERGGGVLFFSGNHNRATQLSGTLLEEILPVVVDPNHQTYYAVDREAERFIATLGPRRSRVSVGNEQSFGRNRVRRQDRQGGVLSHLKAIALTQEGLASSIWRDADQKASLDTPPQTYDQHTRIRSVKPGATVLATSGSSRGNAVAEPVLVVQDIGAGSSAFLGIDALWRWRMTTDNHERGYDRFWQQFVQHLARRSQKTLLALDRYRAVPGEVVTVNADSSQGAIQLFTQPLGDDQPEPPTPLDTVTSPDGNTITARFPAPDADHLRIYAAEPSGRLLAESILTIRRTDLETEFAGINQAVLTQLAEDTGGAMLAVEDIDTLETLLERTERSTTQVQRAELWRNPWVFVALLLIYCGELILRHYRTLV
ncbi:MAG: hypothetical protein AAGH99_12685 [Planctomycetota bacterium]